jgi:hypothetical protein
MRCHVKLIAPTHRYLTGYQRSEASKSVLLRLPPASGSQAHTLKQRKFIPTSVSAHAAAEVTGQLYTLVVHMACMEIQLRSLFPTCKLTC